MTQPVEPRLGVYGLTFAEGLPPDLLVQALPSWPEWTLRWESAKSSTHGSSGPIREKWSPDEALLTVKPEGHIAINRITALTTLFTEERPSEDAFLHPYLASTGIVVANWLGRTPFHCAAFLMGGRAWGVLGGREKGKSSAMMWLHQSGIPVLTDDVLVIDGAVAYAGPRCLDLRASAASRFNAGAYLGVVGTRERWRVQLPSIAPSVPFAGWIVLDWSETIRFEPESLSGRLSALAVHRALMAPGADMTGLLDLLAYPMVRFGRPPDWTCMDEAMQRLLAHLDLPLQGRDT